MKKNILMICCVAIMAIIQSAYAQTDSNSVVYRITAPSGQYLWYVKSSGYAIVTKPSSNFIEPLGDLVIPDSVVIDGVTYAVQEIGDGAFNNCSILTSVTLPSTIRRIGHGAFHRCSGLKQITIPDSVTMIDDFAFSYCVGLISVTIGKSLTDIRPQAFQYCINLTSVFFNADSCTNSSYYVITPEERIFRGCNNLTNLYLGPNVKAIPRFLCDGLTSLTSVVIPSSVKNLGTNAFSNCINLNEIVSYATIAPTNPSGMAPSYGTASAFYGVPSNINVYIPCECQPSYYSRWSCFDGFIETPAPKFNVTSADTLMGSVIINSTPNCLTSTAEIEAIANDGYIFHNWSDGNTDNPRSLTLTSDTTIVAFFSSLVYDTVFVHDTTYVDILVHDTVTLTEYVTVHDTTYIDVHDTTYINVPYPVHDTTIVVDTLTVTQYDTITNTVYDTIDNYVYDTLTVTDTLWLTQYDTLWLHDTIIIHDTVYITEEGIDGVETLNAKVYSSEGRIVVEEADGNQVTLYDVTGRVLATKQDDYSPLRFDAPASGTYLIKIGNHPARRVVVIR